jgi:hypothetical protein
MEDGALGGGRKVRCAACGHSWFAGPDGQPAAAPPPPPPPPPPPGPTRADIERARRADLRPHDQMRARIQASKEKAVKTAALRGYIGAGLLIAGAAGGALYYRQAIVEAWPKAGSAYAMVGLKVNAFGLDYFNVKASRAFQGETPVLKVKGEVRNTSKRARAAPDVRIAIRDKTGKELAAWKTPVDALIIGPGEAAPFASYLANPPAAGYDVAISFVMETGAPKPGRDSHVAETGPAPAPEPAAAETLDGAAHPEAPPAEAPAAEPAAHGDGHG